MMMKRFELVRKCDEVVATDVRPGRRRSLWKCFSRFSRSGNNQTVDYRFEKLGDLINKGGE